MAGTAVTGGFRSAGLGYAADMKVFTKRNALVGALVTWVARRRLERKINRLAGHSPRRRRLLMGAGIATSVAVALGALRARRTPPVDAQVA